MAPAAGGSGNIGSLSVTIGADLKPAQTEIATLKTDLEGLITPEYVITVNSQQLTDAAAMVEQVATAVESISKTANEPAANKKSRQLVFSINATQLRKDIEVALKAPFLITLTVGNAEEIREQLKGMHVSTTVQATVVGSGAGATMQAAETAARGAPPRAIQSQIEGSAGLRDAIKDLYSAINESERGKGRAAIGPDTEDATLAFAHLVETFGDSAEKFLTVGAKVKSGAFSVDELKGRGYTQGEAAGLQNLAKVFVKEAGLAAKAEGGGIFTQARAAENRTQLREYAHPPGPAAVFSTQVQGAQVAARTTVEKVVAAPSAEPTKRPVRLTTPLPTGEGFTGPFRDAGGAAPVGDFYGAIGTLLNQRVNPPRPVGPYRKIGTSDIAIKLAAAEDAAKAAAYFARGESLGGMDLGGGMGPIEPPRLARRPHRVPEPDYVPPTLRFAGAERQGMPLQFETGVRFPPSVGRGGRDEVMFEGVGPNRFGPLPRRNPLTGAELLAGSVQAQVSREAGSSMFGLGGEGVMPTEEQLQRAGLVGRVAKGETNITPILQLASTGAFHGFGRETSGEKRLVNLTPGDIEQIRSRRGKVASIAGRQVREQDATGLLLEAIEHFYGPEGATLARERMAEVKPFVTEGARASARAGGYVATGSKGGIYGRPGSELVEAEVTEQMAQEAMLAASKTERAVPFRPVSGMPSRGRFATFALPAGQPTGLHSRVRPGVPGPAEDVVRRLAPESYRERGVREGGASPYSDQGATAAGSLNRQRVLALSGMEEMHGPGSYTMTPEQAGRAQITGMRIRGINPETGEQGEPTLPSPNIILNALEELPFTTGEAPVPGRGPKTSNQILDDMIRERVADIATTYGIKLSAGINTRGSVPRAAGRMQGIQQSLTSQGYEYLSAAIDSVKQDLYTRQFYAEEAVSGRGEGTSAGVGALSTREQVEREERVSPVPLTPRQIEAQEIRKKRDEQNAALQARILAQAPTATTGIHGFRPADLAYAKGLTKSRAERDPGAVLTQKGGKGQRPVMSVGGATAEATGTQAEKQAQVDARRQAEETRVQRLIAFQASEYERLSIAAQEALTPTREAAAFISTFTGAEIVEQQPKLAPKRKGRRLAAQPHVSDPFFSVKSLPRTPEGELNITKDRDEVMAALPTSGLTEEAQAEVKSFFYPTGKRSVTLAGLGKAQDRRRRGVRTGTETRQQYGEAYGRELTGSVALGEGAPISATELNARYGAGGMGAGVAVGLAAAGGGAGGGGAGGGGAGGRGVTGAGGTVNVNIVGSAITVPVSMIGATATTAGAAPATSPANDARPLYAKSDVVPGVPGPKPVKGQKATPPTAEYTQAEALDEAVTARYGPALPRGKRFRRPPSTAISQEQRQAEARMRAGGFEGPPVPPYIRRENAAVARASREQQREQAEAQRVEEANARAQNDYENRVAAKARADSARAARPAPRPPASRRLTRDQLAAMGIDVPANYGVAPRLQAGLNPFVSQARAAARVAQASLPQRAISTSMIQLAENFFGGREGPLSRINNLQNRIGDVEALAGREESLRQDRGGINVARRGAVRQIANIERRNAVMAQYGGMAGAPVPPELTKAARQFTNDLLGLHRASELNHKALVTASADVAVLAKSAVTAGDVVRNLAAGAVGGVAGGLAAGAVAQVGQVVVQGLAEVLGPQIEKITGFQGTTSRVTGALSDATRAADGSVQTAVASASASAGLSKANYELIKSTVGQRAAVEAGNKALKDQIDLFRASDNAQSNAQGGQPGGPLGMFTPVGIPGLTQATGGFLGSPINATPSTAEQFFGQLPGNQVTNMVGPMAAAILPPPLSGIAQSLFPKDMPDLVGNMAKFNSQLELAHSSLHLLVGATDEQVAATTKVLEVTPGITREQINQQQQARLAILGPNNELPQQGAGVQLFSDINKAALTQSSAVLIAQMTDRVIPAMVHQFQAEQQLQLTQNQASTALNVAGQPIAPLSRGLTDVGTGVSIPPEATATLREYQSRYDALTMSIQSRAASGRAALISQFGVPEAILNQLDEVGKKISDVQADISKRTTTNFYVDYNHQLELAKRNVSDLVGLNQKASVNVKGVGEVKASRVGILEGENLQLSRESQVLGFQGQERSLNLKEALAGFNAPGLTGQERAARLKQAKFEVGIERKQLNISEKIAGNQFEITTIVNQRALDDAEFQLAKLPRDLDVQLHVKADQDVLSLLETERQGITDDIAAFYSTGVKVKQAIISAEVEIAKASTDTWETIVKNTEEAFAKIAKDYPWVASAQPAGEGANAKPSTYDPKTATGGTNTGAGTDSYERHRKSEQGDTGGPGITGAGGGGSQIIIQINGGTFADEQSRQKMIHDIEAAVRRSLERQASLYGVRTPR